MLRLKTGGDNMNKFQLEVKEKGYLPAVSFPGGYPIIYLSKGDILCVSCATLESENIEDHDIHWEGPSTYCDGCNEEIESAYGDPDEE
jgi:hypothetical protein